MKATTCSQSRWSKNTCSLTSDDRIHELTQELKVPKDEHWDLVTINETWRTQTEELWKTKGGAHLSSNWEHQSMPRNGSPHPQQVEQIHPRRVFSHTRHGYEQVQQENFELQQQTRRCRTCSLEETSTSSPGTIGKHAFGAQSSLRLRQKQDRPKATSHTTRQSKRLDDLPVSEQSEAMESLCTARWLLSWRDQMLSRWSDGQQRPHGWPFAWSGWSGWEDISERLRSGSLIAVDFVADNLGSVFAPMALVQSLATRTEELAKSWQPRVARITPCGSCGYGQATAGVARGVFRQLHRAA